MCDSPIDCQACEQAACVNQCQVRTRNEAAQDLFELRRLLKEAGCFDPDPWGYTIRFAGTIAALAIGWSAMFLVSHQLAWALGVVLVAFASVQAGFVGHDIADGAVTRSRRLSAILGHTLLTLSAGMSASYFDNFHRSHHTMVLRGPSGFEDRKEPRNPYLVGLLEAAMSIHGLVYYAVFILLRGALYRIESIRFVRANWATARLDAILLVGHYLIWLVIPSLIVGPWAALVTYLACAAFGGPYLGFVLSLNHEGMPDYVKDDRVPVLEHVLATTKNLQRSNFANFLLGGFNNHIEHHLFSRIPISRLPKARDIMQKFCLERGYAYQQASLRDTIRDNIRHFSGGVTSGLQAVG
jgi:fatty acid desaturase